MTSVLLRAQPSSVEITVAESLEEITASMREAIDRAPSHTAFHRLHRAPPLALRSPHLDPHRRDRCVRGVRVTHIFDRSRATYHGTVGPRRNPASVPDITCLTCGRTVPSPFTHGPGEEWRDLAHPVQACGEVPAGSEAQRVMSHRAGGPTSTDLHLRRLNGARSW